MLCIMPDIFESSFQVYADWKRQTGTEWPCLTQAEETALVKNGYN